MINGGAEPGGDETHNPLCGFSLPPPQCASNSIKLCAREVITMQNHIHY